MNKNFILDFYNVYGMSIFGQGPESFLLFVFTLIVLAGFGIMFLHNNLIVILMCIELILISLGFTFVIISNFFLGFLGFFFAYLLLLIAGAESALALAIITSYFFVEQHVNVEFLSKLKG